MMKLLKKCACAMLAVQMCVAGSALAVDAVAMGDHTNFTVDGVVTGVNAYVVDQAGFVKLRDVAMMMNGTESQFDLTWDATTKTVDIVTGAAYTAVGGELDTDTAVTDQPYKVSEARFSVNGAPTAPFIVYEIAGNNYVKVKELAPLVGYTVVYDTKARILYLYSSETFEMPSKHAVVVTPDFTME